jgi:hypothetical protein
MSQTILILPDTDSTTLYLRVSGTITAEDYIEYFDKPLKAIADTNGWYNLYVFHDENFKGWTPEAADLSFRCISEYSPKARRLAYVNAPDARMLMMRILSPLMHAEVKYFEIDEQEEAIAWMKAYKP